MKSIKLYESLNKVRNLTEEVFEVVRDSFVKHRRRYFDIFRYNYEYKDKARMRGDAGRQYKPGCR